MAEEVEGAQAAEDEVLRVESKCGRCPLRMLKEGTLPDGYAVKKRVLVRAKDGKKASKKDLQKAA